MTGFIRKRLEASDVELHSSRHHRLQLRGTMMLLHYGVVELLHGSDRILGRLGDAELDGSLRHNLN